MSVLPFPKVRCLKCHHVYDSQGIFEGSIIHMDCCPKCNAVSRTNELGPVCDHCGKAADITIRSTIEALTNEGCALVEQAGSDRGHSHSCCVCLKDAAQLFVRLSNPRISHDRN